MSGKYFASGYNQNLKPYGHSCQIEMANLIETFLGEIFRLRGENRYLRRRINVWDKSCYNCGMRGHLARACCRPSRSDCNWRSNESAEAGGPTNTSDQEVWTPDTPDATQLGGLEENVTAQEKSTGVSMDTSSSSSECESDKEINQDIDINQVSSSPSDITSDNFPAEQRHHQVTLHRLTSGPASQIQNLRDQLKAWYSYTDPEHSEMHDITKQVIHRKHVDPPPSDMAIDKLA